LITTLQPRCASMIAAAAPTPVAEPVTIATLRAVLVGQGHGNSQVE
jgi:hypothetical protein